MARGLLTLLPRYTLRTLAIFLLLATCAEALWCHRHRFALSEVLPWSDSTHRFFGDLPNSPGSSMLWTSAVGQSMPEGDIYGGGYSQDGRRFAAAMDGAVRIYDTRDGRCLAEIALPGEDAYQARFSADDKWLYALADRGCLIWRRQRPEQWWGVFCMLEFWFSVIFATALVWSLLADRRYFRRLDAEYAAAAAERGGGRER
jgi:hypothetical protein